uniref:DNA polymerase family B, exonuclease domain n=1 Tax=Pithovirus LCPAC201 TaxID=2506591 RepID=A0A481Z5T5_9VIRU|nr:MAG: DNA polymerase family B, exonuclease domain [Pithovirus LCPAC201]
MNKPDSPSTSSSSIKTIVFRPISWSCIRGNKNNGQSKPLCGIFGYTQQGDTIYVRVIPPIVYLLEYSREVTDQTLAELSAQLGPDSIRRSKNNPKVAILVNPTIDPKQIEIEAQIGSTGDYSGGLFESTNKSVIATWNKSSINPYGPLSSLFRLLRLLPYGWMKVGKYFLLYRPYTIAKVEIQINYDQLVSVNLNLIISPSRFYWDLEVFSETGEFPISSRMGNVIFMGSGSHRSIDKKDNYLFHLKKLNHISSEKNPQPIVIEMKNEGELIKQMVTIHRTLRIDRSYTYNGYGFDSPYLADRSKMLNQQLPPSGKILFTRTSFVKRPHKGFFRKEFSWGLFLPGIEQLDLLPFFKKFYPGLPNHKLETVGKNLIGVGKTGLTIPELNKYYQDSDPEGLKVGGKYALQDSILLADLQEGLGIDQKIERLANRAGITTEEVLRLNDQEIADRYIYQLDPGLYFKHGQAVESSYLSPAESGLYHPVYVYDYSPLYFRALIESKNSLNLKIAVGLPDAYPSLIYKMFYSKVINRDLIDVLLNQYLMDIHSTGIFALTEYLIFSVTPLTKYNGPLVNRKIYSPKLISKHRSYLAITKSSYITLDGEGNMMRYGSSEICNPPYPLAKDVVDQYLKYFFGIGHFVPIIKIGQNTPLEQLVLTTKIRDMTSYSKPSFRKSLAEQFGGNIATWIVIEWVQTNQGPLILSKYHEKSKPSFIITTGGEIKEVLPMIKLDYVWYSDKLTKILQRISALPRYLSLSSN